MLFLSQKNNKNGSEGLVSDEHVEDDPAGKGFVKRSGKVHNTLSNRTSLINGLTVAEQDPALKKATKGGAKNGKDPKKKVGGSGAMLSK